MLPVLHIDIWELLLALLLVMTLAYFSGRIRNVFFSAFTLFLALLVGAFMLALYVLPVPS